MKMVERLLKLCFVHFSLLNAVNNASCLIECENVSNRLLLLSHANRKLNDIFVYQPLSHVISFTGLY